MYDKAFWNRVSIQQLCDFMKTGTERGLQEPGTLEKRYQRYNQALTAELHRYATKYLLPIGTL